MGELLRTAVIYGTLGLIVYGIVMVIIAITGGA